MSKIFDPGQVSHSWFGVGVGKFPPKISNFLILFPSGQKKSLRVGSKSTQVKGGSASYLLWVKSMLGPGQGPSLLIICKISSNFFLDDCCKLQLNKSTDMQI